MPNIESGIQILGTWMRLPCPSLNAVIDSIYLPTVNLNKEIKNTSDHTDSDSTVIPQV